MSISVRVSDELYEAARSTAKAEFRSIPQQIEFWARLGRAAYDNPDLPVDFVRDILMPKMADVDDAEPFVPEGNAGGRDPRRHASAVQARLAEPPSAFRPTGLHQYNAKANGP